MNFRCENLVFGRLNKLMFKPFSSSKDQNISFLGSNGVEFQQSQKVATFNLKFHLSRELSRKLLSRSSRVT